jgi:cyclase
LLSNSGHADRFAVSQVLVSVVAGSPHERAGAGNASHYEAGKDLGRFEGYQGPNLSARGLVLAPRQIADGVHALLTSAPLKNNSGVVAGERGALVVNAGVTPDVARQIQRLTASVTTRPLRYLVNTTYHGNHTFGNAAFPPSVSVISSAPGKASMTHLAS